MDEEFCPRFGKVSMMLDLDPIGAMAVVLAGLLSWMLFGPIFFFVGSGGTWTLLAILEKKQRGLMQYISQIWLGMYDAIRPRGGI